MSQSTIAIIIFICTVVLFVIDKIPLTVVALLSASAMVITGILPFADAFKGFASNSVFLIGGMMVVGYGLYANGIADIIASVVLDKFKKSNKLLLMAILLSSAVLSAFLHNITVIVIYQALILSYAMKEKKRIRIKNYYMALSVGAFIGGYCSLCGSTPPSVANSVLQALTDNANGISFFEPALIGIPVLIVMMICYYLFIYRLGEKVYYKDDPDDKILEEKKPAEKKTYVKWKMWTSLAIAVLAITGFLVLKTVPLGVTAVIAACLMVITGCVDRKAAVKEINWSVLLLLGCMSGFAACFNATGLGESLVTFLSTTLGGAANSPAIWVFVFVIVSGISANVMSVTSTIPIFSTLAVTVATSLNCSPVPLVMACLWGTFTMILPTATTTVTMSMEGGYKVKDYLKIGTLISVIGWISSAIAIILVYGLL